MMALHLFAGAGGSVLAGRLLGWESAGAVEIDPYCAAVLEARGERVLARDIAAFDARPLRGQVDVVVGGWPCQDLSVAGKRAGLSGERSGLFWQMMRVVDECEPRFVFGENVAGLLTSNGGRDFGAVLGALATRGYDARWVVLGARDVGAPHKRERVWILAHRRGGEPPERDGVQSVPPGDADGPAGCGGGVANRALDGREQGRPGAGEREGAGGQPAGVGGAGVANAGRERDAGRGGAGDVPGPTGTPESPGKQRERVRDAAGNGGAVGPMANTWGSGRQERDGVEPRGEQERGAHAAAEASVRGEAEPRMGGAPDGLANGLDWPALGGRWPAGRGAAQHAWEAPRTVMERLPERVPRLKALGNGWVPQCAVLAWQLLSFSQQGEP